MTAYYNEIEPYAADWLENLIADGLIAPGVVDRRDIRDVRPSDLAGFTQCHFFAGIGVWSYALRRAGWPDDRPIWTGSCPCQPFSAAGAGAGTDDERHLWPHWHHLIRVCHPEVLAGEQVEAAIGHGWFDLGQTDMEGEGYACWPVGIPAAGVGAPHIRARGWFVAIRLADMPVSGWDEQSIGDVGADRWSSAEPGRLRLASRLGLTDGEHPRGYGRTGDRAKTQSGGTGDQHRPVDHLSSPPSAIGGLADPYGGRRSRIEDGSRCVDQRASGGRIEDNGGAEHGRQIHRYQSAGPTNGGWRDADWLFCRDGKWRPVEPGTFPLVDAWPGGSRVGMLRAAGNAIVAEAAEAIISTYLESERAGFAPLSAAGSVTLDLGALIG